MNNVINLDEKRLNKKVDKKSKKKGSIPPPATADTRFINAIHVFCTYSGVGNKRQREFLYKILGRFLLKRRPISVVEITEMMISYIRKNRRYFEKITGDSIAFNFDKKFNIEDHLKMINMGIPKPK